MTEGVAITTPAPIAAHGAAAPSRSEVPPEIRRVAEEFEAMALAEMLGPMFEALDTDGLGGGGFGEQMFRPMMVQQYAQNITRAGGVGLADSIVAELMRMQTAQATTAPPAAAAQARVEEMRDAADQTRSARLSGGGVTPLSGRPSDGAAR